MNLLSDQAFPARFILYLVLAGGLLEGGVLLLRACGWEALYLEGGVVEWAQVSTLTLATLGLAWLTLACAGRRSVYGLLALVSLAALVRELNYFELHRTWLTGHGWLKPLIAGGVGLLLVLVGRKGLAAQVTGLSRRPAFLLFLLGTVVVALWAQVLGQQIVWREFYGATQLAGKRFIEEGLELTGYFLICCGVVEECVHVLARDGQVLAGGPPLPHRSAVLRVIGSPDCAPSRAA